LKIHHTGGNVIPAELHYTPEHEWVRVTETGTVVVGITHYAQDALGDIVFVDLPAPEANVEAGGSMGEVESTKSVSELYAPIAGRIIARNVDLEANPETINADPYGGGWLVEIEPDGGVDVSALLSASAYVALTAAE
jgi:glycine cleavage system H protein